MTQYIFRRLLALIPILLGVSIIIFLVMRLIPGDPARQSLGPEATGEQVEVLRKAWRLDEPLPMQYLAWLERAIEGDLGRSTVSRVPVTEEIFSRLPATLELTLASMVVAIVFGLLFGIVSAIRHNSLIDRGTMLLALIGICTPSFWLGLLLLLAFSVKLSWFPSTGAGGLSHLVLPAITLGVGAAAVIARVTRSSMIEVFSEDFIRTARAKGLGERLVVVRHALKNALIPIITILGLEFGGLLAGAVITETVFSYPGIGQLLIKSINNRDFPIVQGVLLLFAIQFVLINLVVDLLYARVDPRISYA
ncbi:MAG TPA: nickel ABC transporter permease [Thermomicrobiales bacterium]|jgi:peptide/nickel transport system permease protein|nr:nickel ABC transporter permease [Thermomicrobiales bacterium]